MNNGSIRLIALTNLERFSPCRQTTTKLDRSLIVDPTRIGHLLCLNAVRWIHARVRLDDRAVDGILQIDERERVIFRRARNINSRLICEVTRKEMHRSLSTTWANHFLSFFLPICCSKGVVDIVERHAYFVSEMSRERIIVA